MFERLMARGAERAERRAEERRGAIADRLEAMLPADITVAEEPGGVLLSGRALRRRMALDPALRWLLAVVL